MSRVDFYILPDDSRNRLQLFACRLAEKAWQQGHRILIHTDSAGDSQQLDDLLWTFRDGSFIPHAQQGSGDDADQPIMISHQDMDPGSFQLLINLSSTTPDNDRFERIAEILNQEESRKQAGRAHYKIYRERGHELHHHDMAGA